MGPLRWFFFQSFFYTESILDRLRSRVNLIFWHFDKITNWSELCRTVLNLRYTLPNSSPWVSDRFSLSTIIVTKIADDEPPSLDDHRYLKSPMKKLGPFKRNLCKNSNRIQFFTTFEKILIKYSFYILLILFSPQLKPLLYSFVNDNL